MLNRNTILILLTLFIFGSFFTEMKSAENEDKPQGRSLVEIDIKKQVKPFLSEWLSFYGLSLDDFELHNQEGSTFLPEEMSLYDKNPQQSFFCVKLDEKEVEYAPLLREYSPDKQYYIPLYEHMTFYDEDKGVYYLGFDDSQTIWLYNTKTMAAYNIQFFGVGGLAHAVYWINNDAFILAGAGSIERPQCFFYLFDLKKELKYYFVTGENRKSDLSKPFYKHILKSRKINLVAD